MGELGEGRRPRGERDIVGVGGLRVGRERAVGARFARAREGEPCEDEPGEAATRKRGHATTPRSSASRRMAWVVA